MTDTKSLIIADIKKVIIRNLYREEKNYKQPIQMYCYSRYKCSRYGVAFTVKTRWFSPLQFDVFYWSNLILSQWISKDLLPLQIKALSVNSSLFFSYGSSCVSTTNGRKSVHEAGSVTTNIYYKWNFIFMLFPLLNYLVTDNNGEIPQCRQKKHTAKKKTTIPPPLYRPCPLYQPPPLYRPPPHYTAPVHCTAW